VELPFVVCDRDAFPLALEEAGLANNAIWAVDHDGLFTAELKLCPHRWIVDQLGELVPRFEFEYVHRAYISTMRAAGALFQLYDDLDHSGRLLTEPTLEVL
jgi:hypothetical protein